MRGLNIRAGSRVKVRAELQKGRLTRLDGYQNHQIMVGDVLVAITMHDEKDYNPALVPDSIGDGHILSVVRIDPEMKSVARFTAGVNERRADSSSGQERIVRVSFDRRGTVHDDIIGAGKTEEGNRVIGGRIELRGGSGSSVTVSPGRGVEGEVDIHII